MSFIYEAPGGDYGTLAGVRSLFEYIAGHKDNTCFDRYYNLLSRAQTDEVDRKQGPTALWLCKASRLPSGAPVMSYVMLNEIHASGISAFTVLKLVRDHETAAPALSLRVHGYSPDEMMIELHRNKGTPEGEGAQRALNMANMLNRWRNRPVIS